MFVKPIRFVLLCLVCTLMISNVLPANAQSSSDNVVFSFKDLGYSDMRLNGLYGVNTMWIPFQSDWPVGNMEIELTYTASPLLNDREAILTILVDNKEITSIRPIGDGRDHTVSFVVPPEERPAGGISITYEGHLRLTDEFCEDSFNTGQWLIVRNSSRVRLSLSGVSAPPELTDLPEAIMVEGEIDVPPVTFVLPEQIDDLTLTVAAQVAYRLGMGDASDNLPIEIATASTLTDQQVAESNLVVVGLPGNQPLITGLIDLIPVPPTDAGYVSQDGVLIPPTDGVLQIFSSPWNSRRNILLVSGNSEEGLAMAGKAFVHELTFQSLTGSFHFIRALVNRSDGQPQEPPWQTDNTSFSQLGEFDRQVTGLGVTDTNYYFHYPPGLMFGEDAQLVLHVAFSPALRTNNSYAVVYINDIYIGAVNVNTTNEDLWLALNLPIQSLNQYARKGHARELNVRLSISNLLPVNNCEQVDKDSSWTKIYADSYFKPNFVPVDLPDLYFFPYPFVGLADNDPVKIVLPDTPTIPELQTTLSLSALMGNSMTGDIDLGVMRSGGEVPSGLDGLHLILLGSPARNPLVEEVVARQKATVPFDIYQVLGNSPVGLFYELGSPWAEGKSALAIYGSTEDGFNAAVSSIYERGKLVNESGSIAVVRSRGEPVIIYRETGMDRPELLMPEEILSGTSPDGIVNGMATQQVSPTDAGVNLDNPSQNNGNLTSTERLILMITVFLVILVAVVALVRIAWRIRA
jgi:hypothetical protein